MPEVYGAAVPLCSFIFPARNEAGRLPNTVGKLGNQIAGDPQFEIIVVDHISTDQTANVAMQLGATVAPFGGRTVGGARNAGARASHGRFFLFLDADIAIEDGFVAGVLGAIERYHGPLIIAGEVLLPLQPARLERIWFGTVHRKCGEIREFSGQCVLTSRETFELVGGFPEQECAGEDTTFCRAAFAKGCHLLRDEHLKVRHLGNATTWNGIIRQSVWYGAGLGQRLRLGRAGRQGFFMFAFGLIIAALSFALGWSIARQQILPPLVALAIMAAFLATGVAMRETSHLSAFDKITLGLQFFVSYSARLAGCIYSLWYHGAFPRWRA